MGKYTVTHKNRDMKKKVDNEAIHPSMVTLLNLFLTKHEHIDILRKCNRDAIANWQIIDTSNHIAY